MLLAIIALFLVCTETTARLAFPRISRVMRRVVTELNSARSIRSDGGSNPTLLLVGNSLLEHGVDFERLQSAMPQNWSLVHVEVSETAYYDWYYGLRRLFAEGARPRIVAVMLSPRETTANVVRGEFFAQNLMRLSDIADVSNDLNLHLTKSAGLAAGNLSFFYGSRADIRNWILLQLLPSFQEVATMLVLNPSRRVDDSEIQTAAEPRLHAMRGLAEEHHSRVLWILPPLLETADGSAGLHAAGASAQVSVLNPIRSGTLPSSDYLDGFHLNSSGASQFTSQLIFSLRQYLSPNRDSGRE